MWGCAVKLEDGEEGKRYQKRRLKQWGEEGTGNTAYVRKKKKTISGEDEKGRENLNTVDRH